MAIPIDLLLKNYIFPMFFASNYGELIERMTYGTLIYAFLVLINPKQAPYGRYAGASFGLSPKIAWFIQESPSFFVPLLISIYGNRKSYRSLSNQICLGLFLMHYFQRTFVFGLLLKSKKPVPFLPFIFAFLTTFYNGILHGVYFVTYEAIDDAVWLRLPFFWIGLALYIFGMYVNIGSDSILRNLRSGSKNSGYVIPEGGLFEYVSCANYFGEIIEMWGYAIASMAPPAIAHAIFTSSFLLRRALHHHEWYLKKFENYPKNRKALIPYLL